MRVLVCLCIIVYALLTGAHRIKLEPILAETIYRDNIKHSCKSVVPLDGEDVREQNVASDDTQGSKYPVNKVETAPIRDHYYEPESNLNLREHILNAANDNGVLLHGQPVHEQKDTYDVDSKLKVQQKYDKTIAQAFETPHNYDQHKEVVNAQNLRELKSRKLRNSDIIKLINEDILDEPNRIRVNRIPQSEVNIWNPPFSPKINIDRILEKRVPPQITQYNNYYQKFIFEPNESPNVKGFLDNFLRVVAILKKSNTPVKVITEITSRILNYLNTRGVSKCETGVNVYCDDFGDIVAQVLKEYSLEKSTETFVDRSK